MELKLFSDLIDALGKVSGGLKAIVSLPKAKREAMRRTLAETYRVIDARLNRLIIPWATSCCSPTTTPSTKTA